MITFDPSVFAKTRTITLAGTQLEMRNTSGTQSITGPAAGVTVSGGGVSRVFQVDANVTASISGLTMTGGNAATGMGGGLANYGQTTLTNSTVSGNYAFSGGGVFNHVGGTVTFSNVAVNGNTASTGAGVRSLGTLTLTNCTVSGNTAAVFAGGLECQGPSTLLTGCTVSDNQALSLNGGGLWGVETLINCTVSGNSAGAQGGGLFSNADVGTTTLTNCTISGNNALGAGGGVYDVAGDGLALLNTIIAGNTAVSGPDAAGAFASNGNNLIGATDGSSGWASSDLTGTIASALDPVLAPLAYYGGPTPTMALLPGSPAMNAGAASGITTDQRGFALDGPIDIGAFQVQADPLMVNITAGSAGSPLGTLNLPGAVDLADVLPGANTITFDPTVFASVQTITLTGTQLELSNTSGTESIIGPAAGVTVSGGGLSRVFQVDANVTASVSGLTITSGNAGPASDGGGLYNIGGSVRMTNCTVSGNYAGVDGGGLSNDTGTMVLANVVISGNTAGSGGGGMATRNGTTTVTNATISGNTAGTAGGGVIAQGAGSVTLTNCTVSGNNSGRNGGGLSISETAALTNCTISANSAATFGGGLDTASGSTAKLTNCTMSGNSAGTRGGGVYTTPGTLTLADTIIAANSAGLSAPDAFGAIASQGHNLIGETDSSSGWLGSDLTGTTASPLDPLLAPLAYYGGSTQTMALLPGSPAKGAGAATGITTDQRGFALDNPFDIGAFQTQSGPLSVNTTVGDTASPFGTLDLRAAVDLVDVLTGANTITFDPIVFGTRRRSR